MSSLAQKKNKQYTTIERHDYNILYKIVTNYSDLYREQEAENL